MKNGQNISVEALRNLPIFSELTLNDSEQIISICKVITYKKKELLFNDGDNYRGFYILLNGSIKIYKLSYEGKESILHLIKPYESFGDVPLFEGGGYPVNAQAISDSILVFIPQKEFIQLIKSNSTICFNMLVGFAKKMRLLTQKVEDLSTKEVSNRFAKFLLDEIKKSGTEKLSEPFARLNLSKKNIASYIGTINDTLSRLLKKLQNEKIIRISGKSIFVLDFSKLKELAK
ncbi:MAG: Crp/Fnr family transcriptional regulator [Ignavibacteriaceae bacterium]|jgi:CRP/FNR family transcriptional regulator|nr:Crp/Fnr family transcriptional regulator [Ignavibacteriaceae bacterium]